MERAVDSMLLRASANVTQKTNEIQSTSNQFVTLFKHDPTGLGA